MFMMSNIFTKSDAIKFLKEAKKSKKRNFEIEKQLLDYPEQAISYANNVIKGRWDLLEKAFLTKHGFYNSKYLVLYCRRVIKKRWIRGEKKILIYSDSSYYYSLYIIKGRWLKGEKSISRSSYYSFLYSTNVLKDHFELGFETIMESRYENDYRQYLLSINKVEYLI